MIQSMAVGGIEASLLGLLRNIDYSKYFVTLLLVRRSGERLGEVPKQVQICFLDDKERIYVEHARYCLKDFRQGKHMLACINRICIAVFCRMAKKAGFYFDSWKRQARYLSSHEEIYDVAIDYDGFHSGYILDKVKAQRKIAWNHFNYRYFDKEKDIF